jgi:hypothetical protein
MAEYQITYWRDFPSMVVARNGDETVKVAIASIVPSSTNALWSHNLERLTPVETLAVFRLRIPIAFPNYS